jgi:hypothetical protein
VGVLVKICLSKIMGVAVKNIFMGTVKKISFFFISAMLSSVI